MANKQIRFYVTEEEEQRLINNAKARFITVPMLAKLTSLGVRVSPPKEVVIEQQVADLEDNPLDEKDIEFLIDMLQKGPKNPETRKLLNKLKTLI